MVKFETKGGKLLGPAEWRRDYAEAASKRDKSVGALIDPYGAFGEH
jgi:hypothetical protein